MIPTCNRTQASNHNRTSTQDGRVYRQADVRVFSEVCVARLLKINTRLRVVLSQSLRAVNLRQASPHRLTSHLCWTRKSHLLQSRAYSMSSISIINGNKSTPTIFFCYSNSNDDTWRDLSDMVFHWCVWSDFDHSRAGFPGWGHYNCFYSFYKHIVEYINKLKTSSQTMWYCISHMVASFGLVLMYKKMFYGNQKRRQQ